MFSGCADVRARPNTAASKTPMPAHGMRAHLPVGKIADIGDKTIVAATGHLMIPAVGLEFRQPVIAIQAGWCS